MSITIKINSVDKSSLIDWTSVRKEQVLTKEPDTLDFDIKNYTSKTYRPALGDDVKLYDTDGTTLVFGGVVIYTEERVEGLLKYLTVQCKDYSHTLDRKLVAKTYTSQTVVAIITDILTNFTDGTFTHANTTDTTVIDSITFNYLPVSECLKKLASMLSNYSWYVDYTKDIHFYQDSAVPSTITLTDTSGNFMFQSLVFHSDITQIQNHIYLRGGITTGTAFSDFKIADGKQNTFFVGYDLVSYTFYKALAASPTSFVALTSGADGTTDPTTVDVLYNPTTGFIRFANSNTPAINDVVKWTGTPTYPLIAQKSDLTSIALFGEYQKVIIDKNITTVTAASQRLTAELAKWSAQVDGGEFMTYTAGFKPGINITITSTLRSISQTFKIDRVATTLKSPTAFSFKVKFITTDDVTMQDILNRLLVTDPSNQVAIDPNEIVQLLFVANETITISEVVVTSISHNPVSETITLGESTTVQALDYATIFVVGPQVPTSTKRIFILNGSYLA